MSSFYCATPTAADIEAAKVWWRSLYDDGWVCFSWPSSSRGRDATGIEQVVFAEEMANAGHPRELNLVGLQLAGRMIMAFGTPRTTGMAPQVWIPDVSVAKIRIDLSGNSRT